MCAMRYCGQGIEGEFAVVEKPRGYGWPFETQILLAIQPASLVRQAPDGKREKPGGSLSRESALLLMMPGTFPLTAEGESDVESDTLRFPDRQSKGHDMATARRVPAHRRRRWSLTSEHAPLPHRSSL